ncbi:hypothetical protein H6G64_35370 [Calothrix sp. FACHB-156]|nr:hypothetical protein [Calothrix sp. FACHB-156]
MAQRKGGITGADLNPKSRRKNKTTPDFEKPDLGKVAESVGEVARNVANGVGAARDNLQTIANTGKQVKRAFNGGSKFITSEASETLEKAQKLARDLGIESIDLAGEMTSNPYSASTNIPEMSAKEANQLKLQIQRQNNALDVRYERRKQQRKIAAVATEELRLVGDLVDYQTTGIETATKVIKQEIAATKYQIEQSKLEETEELLEQQIIKTTGVISLTEGIRTEWNLKLEKQQANNQKLKLEVEGAIRDTERKREELEARLLEG